MVIAVLNVEIPNSFEMIPSPRGHNWQGIHSLHTLGAVSVYEVKMDYKYTSSGKKVSIISNVNANEYIVQEVMVKGGIEVLSGVNIVERNLHDQPVETWADNRKKRLEKEIETLEKEVKDIEFKAKNARKFIRDNLDHRIKWVQGIKDEEVKDLVRRIKSFALCEYTHIVYTSSWHLGIEEFSQSSFVNGEGEMRLVSLFGKWNGRLSFSWKVNQYKDGSGNSNDTFIPCKSLEEAKKELKKYFDSLDDFSDSDYNCCIKYGIEIDPVKNEKRIEQNIAGKNKDLVRQIELVESIRSKIEEYKSQSLVGK